MSKISWDSWCVDELDRLVVLQGWGADFSHLIPGHMEAELTGELTAE
jgi:hypothetical protein